MSRLIPLPHLLSLSLLLQLTTAHATPSDDWLSTKPADALVAKKDWAGAEALRYWADATVGAKDLELAVRLYRKYINETRPRPPRQ